MRELRRACPVLVMVMLGGDPMIGLLLLGAGNEGVEAVVGSAYVMVPWQRKCVSLRDVMVVQGDIEVGEVQLVDKC